ncbi:hypothetical protein WA158_000775 [Blastocystis sp. Blastoise]
MCNSTDIYLRAIHKCGFKLEEYWRIYDMETSSGIKVYEGLVANQGENITMEICIPRNTKLEYVLELYIPKSVTGEAADSVSIFNSHSDLVIQVAYKYARQHNYTFYLSDSISSGSQYKYINTISTSDWYKKSYDDSTWTSVLGSAVAPSTLTSQYYRRSFSIDTVNTLSGFTLGLLFSGTIQVYINDKKVWDYNSALLILPASLLESNNLISIFLTSISSTKYIDFYISLNSATYSPTCSSVLYSPTYSSSSPAVDTYPLDNMFDFISSTYWKTTLSTLPAVINITLPYKTFINSNMYGFPPISRSKESPKKWTLSARVDPRSALLPIDHVEDPNTSTYVFVDYTLFSNTLIAHDYQLVITEGMDTSTLSIYEFYLYVCNEPYTPFEYPQSSYSFTNYIHIPSVTPVYSGYSQITIQPNLPAGLTFNSQTGAISGTPIALSPLTQYTITSTSPITVSFSISIEVKECEGSRLRIYRRYGTSTGKEVFNITALSTNSIVYWESNRYTTSMSDPIWVGDSEKYIDICGPAGDYRVDYIIDKTTYNDWDSDGLLSIYYTHFYETDLPTVVSNSTLLFTGIYRFHGPLSWEFSTDFPITRRVEWKYNKGSIPTDWFKSSFDDSQWLKATSGSFGPMNHAEIYRHTFTMTSIPAFSSYAMEIRYIYGILIYINDQEIYRNRIPDPFSIETNATAKSSSVSFKKISFSSASLHTGSNTIAILLLGSKELPYIPSFNRNTFLEAVNEDASFDMTLYSLGYGYNRAFISAKATGDATNIDAVTDNRYITFFSIKKTSSTGITIYDKQEENTILSYYSVYIHKQSTLRYEIPCGWTLQARVSDAKSGTQSPWETIDVQSNIIFNITSDIYRHFYIPAPYNTRIYTEFKFTSFTGALTDTYSINAIDLFANYPIHVIQPLSYSQSSYTLPQYRYMDAIIPETGHYYQHFTVTPSLPTGITMNPSSGIITGKTEDSTTSPNYRICATDYTQKEMCVTIALTIEVCGQGNAILGVDIHYYYANPQLSYYIYPGDKPEGDYTFIYTIDDPYLTTAVTPDPFLIRSYTYCLPLNLYTLRFKTEDKKTWRHPAGYSILNTKTLLTSGMFSIHDTEFTITVDLTKAIEMENFFYRYLLGTPTSDWFTEDFEDTQWSKGKSGTINTNEPEVYIRTLFSLEDTSTHSVLNIDIDYSHELTLYINGYIYTTIKSPLDGVTRKTLRFPIQTNYIRKSDNVLAIQLNHLSEYKTPFYIDISISYDYGTVASLLPSFEVISATPLVSTSSLEYLFDNNIYTVAEFQTPHQTDIHMKMLQPTLNRFNTLEFYSFNETGVFYVSLKGKEKEEFDWISIFDNEKVVVSAGSTFSLPCPIVLGFTYLLLSISNLPVLIPQQSSVNSASVIFPDISFSFKRSADSICQSIDDFPAVPEGLYSYTFCGEGYMGYKSRYCDGLKLKKENTEKCSMLPLAQLHYTTQSLILNTYTSMSPLTPMYINIALSFTISPNLPSGLTFDTATGIISGLPVVPSPSTVYTITAINENNQITTTITIHILPGSCPAIGDYPQTTAGITTTIGCVSGYFGSRHRSCIPGTTELYWEDPVEECTSITMVSILLGSVAIIIICVIYILIKRKIYQKKLEELNNLKKKSGGVVSNNDTYVNTVHYSPPSSQI